MSNKIKLGIFIPSSFNNYQFLEEILNKKIDQIGLLISNASGYNLVERYGKEKNIPYLSYPIDKACNVLCSNEKIIKASDKILILENGQSSNNEKVREKCFAANQEYREIQVPEELTCQNICAEIKEIFEEYQKEKVEFNFGEWLDKHVRTREKLIKEIGKIK